MRRREFIAALGGAAVAWPLAARAQQRPLPVVGFLTGAPEYPPLIVAFRHGLAEQGYVEGRNTQILYRFADGRYELLPALATELVGARVDVIAALGGTAPVLAARSATSTTPIVFTTGTDPVGAGLVSSLNHPGGYLTGVTFLTQELTAKRLELLHEVLPATTSIGFLVNPAASQAEPDIKEAQLAARILGVRLVVLNASTPNEIEATFAIIAQQKIGALLLASDNFFAFQSPQIAALAAQGAVPTIYAARDPVESGGLMSYGARISDGVRLAGTYVGRILKGEKPSDLPVQQSTRIEMVLNLKTARALGIEVPTATLLRATEVIE